MTNQPSIDLPAIGLGTYRLRGSAGASAVLTAIDSGYRLIDSAFNYENEGAVGDAVRQASVPREEIIVTSKLPGRHHAIDHVEYTVEESVMRMGLDYIDLYLIHWPNPAQGLYVQAWEGLVRARDRGLVKHIGVSNFLPEHITRIAEETGELPEVNQIELHPYFPQTEQLAWHRERGIVTEAWSPVGRGNDLKTNPTVVEVARNHAISPVQAILAWHVAIGSVPLPKSADAARQRENLDAARLELTAQEIDSLTALGRPDGRLKDQDPARYEEF